VIVHQIESGWEIIYHRAHALLAAEIAGHWSRQNSPMRLIETVAAISHHDDLEKEWEEKNITPVGAPLDFTLDKNTDLPKLKKHVTNSRYRGRWVAMLISMHTSFLNEGKRGESEELDSFLDEQLQMQEQIRKELQISKQEAEQAYAFMQWCDRFSLILCQQQLPEDERALEISIGPQSKSLPGLLKRKNLPLTLKLLTLTNCNSIVAPRLQKHYKPHQLKLRRGSWSKTDNKLAIKS